MYMYMYMYIYIYEIRLLKSHISFGEQIISFERAEMNHAKVASRQNNSPRRCQFTFHMICINFQVVVFLRMTSENL